MTGNNWYADCLFLITKNFLLFYFSVKGLDCLYRGKIDRDLFVPLAWVHPEVKLHCCKYCK